MITKVEIDQTKCLTQSNDMWLEGECPVLSRCRYGLRYSE